MSGLYTKTSKLKPCTKITRSARLRFDSSVTLGSFPSKLYTLPCSSDYIIIHLGCRVLREHCSLLPYGIVVAPSSLLRLGSGLTLARCFPEFSLLSLTHLYVRGLLCQSVSHVLGEAPSGKSCGLQFVINPPIVSRVAVPSCSLNLLHTFVWHRHFCYAHTVLIPVCSDYCIFP